MTKNTGMHARQRTVLCDYVTDDEKTQERRAIARRTARYIFFITYLLH